MSSLFGVMVALVSFVEEDDNALKMIKAGEHKIVFLRKENIIVVMASASGESEYHMTMELNYIYSQIVFTLTSSQVSRIFKQSSNFDLRRMIGGTEKLSPWSLVMQCALQGIVMVPSGVCPKPYLNTKVPSCLKVYRQLTRSDGDRRFVFPWRRPMSAAAINDSR